MPRFSIIIPAYNAENCIINALESITNQTFKDYEVIIINDGSSDSTFSLCSKYSRINSKVRLFTQTNKGVSAARNVGLEYALGDYIVMLDSDDYLPAFCLAELNTIIDRSNPDVLFYGHTRIYHSNNTYKEFIPPNNIACLDMQSIIILLDELDLYGYSCAKTFKRSCINDVRFREDLPIMEDEVFTNSVLMNCRNVSILSKSLYFYNIYEDTSSHKYYPDFLIFFDTVYQSRKQITPNYSNQIATRLCKHSLCIYFENNISTVFFAKKLVACSFYKETNRYCNLYFLIAYLYFFKLYYCIKFNLSSLKRFFKQHAYLILSKSA